MGIDMCFYFLFNEFVRKNFEKTLKNFEKIYGVSLGEKQEMPIPEASRRFHIIIDAFNCQKEFLSDKEKIDKVIKDIAGFCGMTLLHGPVVVDGVPENPGVTAFAIIDFSHISIHTFTKDRELCVDIFSCKPFSYHKVKEYVKKEFGLEDEYVKYVEVKYQPALRSKPLPNYPHLANS